MSRQQLDTWCEWGIFGLVMMILVWSPLATGAVRPQDFVVVEWLCVGVLALWLPRFWLNPKHRLLWPPLCWAVIAFMAYAVGRYWTADVEYIARQEMIRVLVYGFLFLAILHNLYHLERIQLLTFILLGLGMAIALYAMVQYLTESNRVWHFIRPENYYKRGSGTFICPNNLAGYLELLLPLGLSYTLTGRLSHVTKILIGYASLMIFTGIVVSVSRGGWAATAISLGVLFFWLMNMRDYRLQGALLLGALVAIATVFVLKAELSHNRKDSISSMMAGDDLRLRLWQPAWKMWGDHPWWGVGPGHFDTRFRGYRPSAPYPDQLQVRPERVHNDYLNTLVDWGLAGALLVAGAWFLFYWDVFRSWKFVQRAQNDLTTKRSNKSAFVMGGSLGLLAILVHSAVDFNMHIPANAILTVTLMALVAAHFRYATERYWHTVRLPMRVLVTLVLAAGGGYLGTQTWRHTIEAAWLQNAEVLPYGSRQRRDALERAFQAEPANAETAYEVGEHYRLVSWQGWEGYRESAETAMDWFDRAIQLNRFDPYSAMRYGMCLHWLKRHKEAGPFFERAFKLDPNGYYTLAHMGWHYVQLEDWANAKKWFQQSMSLFWTENPIAQRYLPIVEARLAEKPPAAPGSIAGGGTAIND